MPLTKLELDSLCDAMMSRLDEELPDVLLRVNRTGDLENLLDLLDMSDLLGIDPSATKPKRILVIGESCVTEPKLKSLAKGCGIDPSLFDFALGYDSLKHYNFAKLRYSATYRAVLAGPMPHSTPGKQDASSVIAEMEAHPEIYPPVFRLKDSSGLKITNTSFTKCLKELKELAG